MSCSVTRANSIIMNKYLWMCHQLRNFNDVNSLIAWSHAMNCVKNLLLQSLTVPLAKELPLLSQSSNLRSGPVMNQTNTFRPTISPQSTMNFTPTTLEPLTKSTQIYLNFKPKPVEPFAVSPNRSLAIQPRSPSPLSISTSCQQAIKPSSKMTKQYLMPPKTNYPTGIKPPPLTKTSSHFPTKMEPSPSTKKSQPFSTDDDWIFCYDETNFRKFFWNKRSGAAQLEKPICFNLKDIPARWLPINKDFPR